MATNKGIALAAACGLALAASGQLLAGRLQAQPAADTPWAAYNGGVDGQHYSPLAQINRANVAQLKAVWRFDAGVGGLQTNPLVIGGVLYAYTPDQRAIALDATSGRLIWKFDPGTGSEQPARGMAYWADGGERRLFVSNARSLYALDPATGRPSPGFGDGGRLDLSKGLGRDDQDNAVFLTTPGVIYRDLIIVGFRTAEAPPAPPGDIRAYDVRSGKLRWTFHTIPRPGEPGAETWPKDAWKTAGAANNWAGMALDAARGIVFVPTGSAVFDFYGGDRAGDNLYADSLLALDAATGKLLWRFKGVHHDIWDRDFPAPPALVTVARDGRRIDAVAQTTKQGWVLLFERTTGKPLFPIEERPVPASDVPGEQAWPTQPFPLAPAPFARQELTEETLTNRTPQARADALARFHEMRNRGAYTPWQVGRSTLIFPGFDGGAEWGGPAVDPASGVLYVNSNEMAWYTGLVANAVATNAGPGEALYASQCAACHGVDRKGSPPQFPALTDVGARLTADQIAATIASGRGRMPGFPQIADADRRAIAAYLLGQTPAPAASRELAPTGQPAEPMKYLATGYNRFLDPDGYPAIAPPWGTLNAIDLNTGRYLWKIPLGQYPELAAQGLRDTGSENYGGPIVTAGGLLFIGATLYDRKLRAFDSRTGALLWQADLPFAGAATPATYEVHGRQYVVIATSGARDRKGPQGSAYVAFALPESP